MGVKRILASAGAVAVFASAAAVGVVGVTAPAHAAGQTLTVTPNSGLKGGQKVTVTYSGYAPNGPIAVGVCPTGRKVQGPGDCGRSKNGNSKLTTADASGKGTTTITIPEGPLGNQTPPSASCPPCTMGATNIGNAKETATVDLNYASGGGNAKATSSKSSSTSSKSNATASSSKNLAKTGPRETLITALVGFALLQLGLVFAVRAHRSSPRRSAV